MLSLLAGDVDVISTVGLGCAGGRRMRDRRWGPAVLRQCEQLRPGQCGRRQPRPVLRAMRSQAAVLRRRLERCVKSDNLCASIIILIIPCLSHHPPPKLASFRRPTGDPAYTNMSTCVRAAETKPGLTNHPNALKQQQQPMLASSFSPVSISPSSTLHGLAACHCPPWDRQRHRRCPVSYPCLRILVPSFPCRSSVQDVLL